MLSALNQLFSALTSLWEMSLTGAFAAGVVLLLRLALKNQALRQAVCLLWLMVFARLLLPVSFQSPFSAVPQALTDIPAATFPGQALAAGVWLAGVLAMVGYALISYLLLRRRLFDAVRTPDGAW